MLVKNRDLENLSPASTGLLIASILFAKTLWILDATSMSLYWVARLPIDRPAKQDQHISLKQPIDRAYSVPKKVNRRTWKIALSLAIVGALAAPFISKAYKARPTYSVWVPLTAQQKQNLSDYLENNNWCESLRSQSTVSLFVCREGQQQFLQGGEYQYHLDNIKYFGIIGGVIIATFITLFGLALLIPILFRGIANVIQRYLKWLDT